MACSRAFILIWGSLGSLQTCGGSLEGVIPGGDSNVGVRTSGRIEGVHPSDCSFGGVHLSGGSIEGVRRRTTVPPWARSPRLGCGARRVTRGVLVATPGWPSPRQQARARRDTRVALFASPGLCSPRHEGGVRCVTRDVLAATRGWRLPRDLGRARHGSMGALAGSLTALVSPLGTTHMTEEKGEN